MADKYRRNAGIVVFNHNKKVLLCQRNDVENAWQFPQGGIEKDETPAQAALRELKEETSIENVVIIKTLNTPVRYQFPPSILSDMKKRGFNNIGQEMYWSLCFFKGDDKEINLHTKEAEFSVFRWGSLEEAVNLVADFKKGAYMVAVNEFKQLISEFKIPTSDTSGHK